MKYFAKLTFILFCILSCKTSTQTSSSEAKISNAPNINQMFIEMDANKDDKLSMDEVKGPLKNDFTKIDTNSDGFISKEELSKAPKPNRQDPPNGQQGPPPPNR